jgi:ribosomal protein S18 acetylase RimI-like enzyme
MRHIPPEGLEVRVVRDEELDMVGALTLSAFRAVAGPRLSDAYATELADVAGRVGASVVLVAELAGEVVGAVAYVGDPASPMAEMLGPGEAGIRMLAVDPRAQGGGVGGSLVAACVELARAQERVAIALFSTEAMVAAHRLYVRAGFARVPERDWEPVAGLRLLSFVKELR